MESLRLSFEAIAPIFLLMLLGYALKHCKIADKNGFDTVNKLVFKAFLPVMLFYNIYKTAAPEVFNLKLVLYTVASVLCIFILGYFAVLLITKENPKRGVMLQGFFRGNYAILGIPIVGYICGNNASGLASFMVVVVIPVFNILAVIALERFRKGNEKVNILRLLKGIITNPLIIGCIAGMAVLLMGIKLPHIIEESVRDVASAATPLAIIVLGAGFEFSSIRGNAKEIAIVVLTRLILIPLLVIPVAVLLGFSGEALACLLVIFGAPIAVSSFPMSQQMGGDEKLCAQVIVMSSVLCLLTLFMWILILSTLGLF